MFRREKTETIPFKEFMSGEWKEKQKIQKELAITKYSLAGLITEMTLKASPVHASVLGDVVLKAFSPIIDLVQGISYPVAFLMISGGFILIMTGQTSRGLHFIKWACLGYIGLQFAPALMQIVVEIGQNITAEVGKVK